MPTIFQINTRCNEASHGKIAEQIGNLVLKQGWRSIIAYGRGNAKSVSESFKIGNPLSVYWHGLQSRFFDNHGLASNSATRELIQHIKSTQPDIIHLHNIHGYYLNYELLFDFLREYNRPVVWTLHDCWPITGHCSFFSLANCLKWISGCFDCPLKKDYPASILLDRSSSNYNRKKLAFTNISNLHIVTVSKWLHDVVKQSFLGYADVQVINNGVDLDVFSPFNTNSTSSKFNILGVSNVWEPRKGLDDFIKLRSLLSDEYSITLVGLSSKQIDSIPKGIKGLPKTNTQQELSDLYAKSDVLISMSYAETFGMTIVESYACGTPVIVYDNTALSEFRTAGNKTGYVVENGNVESVVEAIKEIQKLGKNSFSQVCRDIAVSKYNKDYKYQDYINIYKSLLNFNSSTLPNH